MRRRYDTCRGWRAKAYNGDVAGLEYEEEPDAAPYYRPSSSGKEWDCDYSERTGRPQSVLYDAHCTPELLDCPVCRGRPAYDGMFVCVGCGFSAESPAAWNREET